jgi:jouberin
VIDVESRSKNTHKLLPHPSFIYSVKFHPNSNQIIGTSCYDKVIRVWTIKTKKSDKNGRLLQELNGHHGYVNSLCFSLNGKRLYSADSVGCIKEWNCYINEEKKSVSESKILHS